MDLYDKKKRMDPSQLKYRIIDKLNSIRDVALLEKIDHLMGSVNITKRIFNVSANQQSMLQRICPRSVFSPKRQLKTALQMPV